MDFHHSDFWHRTEFPAVQSTGPKIWTWWWDIGVSRLQKAAIPPTDHAFQKHWRTKRTLPTALCFGNQHSLWTTFPQSRGQQPRSEMLAAEGFQAGSHSWAFTPSTRVWDHCKGRVAGEILYTKRRDFDKLWRWCVNSHRRCFWAPFNSFLLKRGEKIYLLWHMSTLGSHSKKWLSSIWILGIFDKSSTLS